MPLINENNIRHQRCDFCGKERPIDWFGKRDLKILIRYSTSRALTKTITYRKYKACWKCREFNADLRVPLDPRTVVPKKYQTSAYKVIYETYEVNDEE